MPFEVRRLGRTIAKWRHQIVAWHRSHVSNGPTEAVNNLVKRVKRVGVRVPPLRPLPDPLTPLRRPTQLDPARHPHPTLKREAPDYRTGGHPGETAIGAPTSSRLTIPSNRSRESQVRSVGRTRAGTVDRSRRRAVMTSLCLQSRASPTGTLGRCPSRYSRASGTVHRLVGPVDLARFDSTVKVPTEGSRRASRHPGRRVSVRSLCDGPDVHSAGSARIGIGRLGAIIDGFVGAVDPAFVDYAEHRPRSAAELPAA